MNEHQELPRLLGRFRGAFLSVGIFSFFYNLLMLTLPFYMLSVFTRVLTSKSDETLVLLTIAAAIALTMQGLLDFVRSRVLIRIGIGFDGFLTPQVLESVVRNAAGSTRRNTQSLRDATELRNYLTGNGVLSLFDAPFVPLYVAVIYMLHPMLGTLALGGALILLLIAVINEMVTRKPIQAASQFTNRAQARVDDFVRNADAVEAMGMMSSVIERWKAHNSDALSALSQAADKATSAGALAKSVRMGLQVGLFGMGAYLFIHNEILPGAIIAAAILMGRALAPVESAINSWRSFVSGKAAYDRLRAALDPERLFLSRDRMSLPKPKGRLQLERVVVMAPGSDRMILKGISLRLGPGQFLGVIGPSGAGKTTLAKVLVGILAPRGGDARLDGAEMASWHPDDLGKYIGYLPQDVQLFPGTVRENISRMATDSDSDDVIRAAQLAGVHETVLSLPDGYETDIGEAGSFLSAGQRQHIALARAFYGDPSLIVLDEPNSNLDAVSENALRAALQGAKERGVTIVVITHRPSVLSAADQVLLLKEGSIDLYGPSEEVMARVSQGAVAHAKHKRIAVVKDHAATVPSARVEGRHVAESGKARSAWSRHESAELVGEAITTEGEVENIREKEARSGCKVADPEVAGPGAEAGSKLLESTIVRSDGVAKGNESK
jgi:PrtD family type I secretion system ABC transporter